MFGDVLTHWGRRTHICVAYLTIIGSDNGLSPSRCQVIIWTNAGILLIRPLGTYFSEILITIETFSFKKMHLKISSAKWRPFCLGFNVLKLFAIIPGLYENSTQCINYLPGSVRDTCYGSISPYQLLMKMAPRTKSQQFIQTIAFYKQLLYSDVSTNFGSSWISPMNHNRFWSG